MRIGERVRHDREAVREDQRPADAHHRFTGDHAAGPVRQERCEAPSSEHRGADREHKAPADDVAERARGEHEARHEHRVDARHPHQISPRHVQAAADRSERRHRLGDGQERQHHPERDDAEAQPTACAAMFGGARCLRASFPACRSFRMRDCDC